MANVVTTKLTKLSNQYSDSVKELRELKAKLRSGGAGVSDAEAKRLNALIKTVDAKRLKLMEDYNKLKKLEKPAADYISISGDIKDIQAQINKATARGENTNSLQAKLNTLTSKFNFIAPKVEAAFPEIKVKLPSLGGSYYTGKGTKANPFLQSGKLFTGTYNNRKYKDGIEVTAAAPTGTTPTPSATATPAPTPNKPTGSTTATGTGATGTGATGTGATGTGATETPPTAAKLTIQEIIDKVAKNYGAIDAIFKTDTELQSLLQKAIGADGIPGTTDDLTVNQFTNELQNTNWFKKSAGELQRRGFYKRQYDELRKTLGAEDLKNLDNTSEYGRGLKNTRQIITDEAKRQGVTLDEAGLDLMARDLYDFANEDKPALIRAALRAKIFYQPGQASSGVTGENITALRATAAANGLDLDKNFGGELQGWLQNIAQGESIETYKQRIRDVNSLSVPDSVKKLISQGIDLGTIFSPYKELMSKVLELNVEEIGLNDPTLRTAITGTEVLNMYDFKKQLKKDSRWQYTANAKEEVADSTLRVLRDFGFQG